MKAHFAVYSIPRAAALWCGVPEDELEKVLKEARPISESGIGRCIWKHVDIPCLEYRSRAIAEATEDGSLPHGREDGNPVDDYVAYPRRHFYGRELKKWMETAFPNEKPAFLFDDIERSSHPAISADAYRALKAECDALKIRLENAKTEYLKLRDEKIAIECERDSLKLIAENAAVPSERAETTYQNIIAALLDCIAGNLPSIDSHPSFPSEAKLIDAIDHHFDGYNGLSKSNLSRKFPEAKRALQSQ
jgi:hypothetical protein